MNITYAGRTFANVNFDLEGIVVFCRALDAIGKSPQPAANKASSKAAAIVKRSIKARAPKKVGTLKRSIVTRAEKSKLKGKKVRQITFSKESSAVLQKPIKRPGLYGGKHAYWGYYPASQEYGFLTRAKDGGIEYRTFSRITDVREKNAAGRWKRKRVDEIVAGYQNRKVEGKYYMRKGAEAVESEVQAALVETMGKELDRLWQKASHA